MFGVKKRKKATEGMPMKYLGKKNKRSFSRGGAVGMFTPFFGVKTRFLYAKND
jgi:hypothetical protein